MKFDWSRAGLVRVISSIAVAIFVVFPEHTGLAIGLILGLSVSITGMDRKLYKKIKERIK